MLQNSFLQPLEAHRRHLLHLSPVDGTENACYLPIDYYSSDESESDDACLADSTLEIRNEPEKFELTQVNSANTSCTGFDEAAWREKFNRLSLQEQVEHVASDDSPPIWSNSTSSSSASCGESAFESEIQSFLSFIRPTREEHAVRSFAIRKITDAIHSNWQQATVDVVGSFLTKTYLPASDINLVVVVKRPPTVVSFFMTNCHYALGEHLKRYNIGQNIVCEIVSDCPHLRFVETNSMIEFDIRFTEETQPNFQPQNFVQHAAVNPLTLILKHLLRSGHMYYNGINGGLNGYALTLLIISFLQQLTHISNSEENNGERVGELLISMLQYYGKTFAYDKVGISVSKGGYVDRNASDDSFLLLVDPHDPGNNVTGKCTLMMNITKRLFSTSNNLQTALIESINGNNVCWRSFLASVLRINLGTIERRKIMMELYEKLPNEYKNELVEFKDGRVPFTVILSQKQKKMKPKSCPYQSNIAKKGPRKKTFWNRRERRVLMGMLEKLPYNEELLKEFNQMLPCVTKFVREGCLQRLKKARERKLQVDLENSAMGNLEKTLDFAQSKFDKIFTVTKSENHRNEVAPSAPFMKSTN